MDSDADLLDAWRRGDNLAAKNLAKRHWKTVARFFGNKITVAEDRDDLIQETFRRCVEGRDRIADSSRFKAYLIRIAFNVLKRYIREKYSAAGQELLSRSLQDIAPGPSTMLHALRQRRRLISALRELPLDMQTAIELKYWEGMSSREIASVLGTKAATVRSTLRRGRMLLEQRLGDAAPEQRKAARRA